MANIEDPALRLRIAFKLFDSEGVQMVNMLGDGSAAMHEAYKEVERLGIITDEQARQSEEYADKLTALKRAFSFLGHTIGVAFLPKVQSHD